MFFQFGLFGSNGATDPTKLTPSGILELMLFIARYALGLIGAIVFLYIVIAGIQYITAGGDPGKQGEARKAIQAALIGMAITILAFSIVSVLLNRLGFDASILNEAPNEPIKSEGLFK